jgi:RAB protein geranylgeranyltransferase component A
MNLIDMEYGWTRSTNKSLYADLMNKSRRFNIDLCPNVFYSRGKFIELLISSDVSKYSEFRLVSQILAQDPKSDDNSSVLEKVPTSRSDVFKSNQLSIIEKRFMMQFLQKCLKENFDDLLIDVTEPTRRLSFKAFVERKKMPESVRNYLVNAVAMCPDEANTALEVNKN